MTVGRLLAAVLVLVLGAPAVALADGGPEAPRAATLTALVIDQYGETMTVEEPSFWRAASGLSLGGGGKGTKLKEMRVWKGAHEILVPMDRLVKIDVIGAAARDLLSVRLTLVGGVKLEAKVERDLELRGRVQYGQHQIKLERVKSVTVR